jgi:ATP-dependent helicase IRC3
MQPALLEDKPSNTGPIILRPYQEKGIQAYLAARDRRVKRMLAVYPTGTGKTSLFAALIGRLAEEDDAFTALVLAHRKELLTQASDRINLQNPSLRVDVESGEFKAHRGASVVVAGVQAIGGPGSEKLDWLAPSLVICDEAHHGAADTYQNVFRRMGCYMPAEEGGAELLGVTATPHRLDNKALHGSEAAIFEEIIFQYSLKDAIREGYLCDLKGYRVGADIGLDNIKTVGGDYNPSQLERVMNTDPLNELAFKSWSEAAPNHRTIVFCAGVDHAERMSEIFREGGIEAASVNGAMNRIARDEIIRRFRSGSIQVLTNVDIATEGFDVPECGCVMMLRPTQSWALFSQMIGRGLRVLPGLIDGVDEADARRAAVKTSEKPFCVVIDVVDNTRGHQLGKTPKDGKIPSLNEMVGLPTMLDLEGHTLGDAAEMFDDLPEVAKAVAMRHPTTFSGLSAKLTAVDMLGELGVPDEATKADARLHWLKVSEWLYIVSCGFSESETSREARLEGDILGHWSLTLISASRNEVHPMPPDLTQAFQVAERVIRGSFFGVMRFADAKASWKHGAVTERQIAALMALGADPVVFEQLTRGSASALIDRLRADRRGI